MSTIGRNLLALALAQVATWCAMLGMLVIVPRFLGDVQYGQLNFAGAFVALFGMLASFGSSPLIIKMTARDSSLMPQYVLNALAITALLVLLLSGFAIGTIVLIGYPRDTALLVAAYCVGMALGALNGPLIAALQGQQRMGGPALWGVVQIYLSDLVVIAVLVFHKGLVLLALASALTGAISLLANGIRVLPKLRTDGEIDLGLWKPMLLGGAPFLVWTIVQTIYSSIDVTMLSMLTENAVVGWYALADKLISVPFFVPTLIITVFFPSFAAYAAQQSPAFISLVNRALRLVFFACAPVATGIALIAASLISLLGYPAGFIHSVPLIRILALDIPLAGMGTVLGAALMASDRQKAWAVYGAFAAAFNVLLNFAAIPVAARLFGNGAIGAAVVTDLTELLVLWAAFHLQPKGMVDVRTGGFVLRCGLACAAMAGGVVLLGESWLPVRVVLGITIYVASSLVLGTLPMGTVRQGTRRLRTLLRGMNLLESA